MPPRPATFAPRPTVCARRYSIGSRTRSATHARGARVLDLFAGTGALGLEALSRGARFALFVDDGSEARALVRANVEAFGVGGITRIFRRDATKLGHAPSGEPFTLAFLDPPYGQDLAPRALQALADGGWLAPDALCIIEEEAGTVITLPAPFALLDTRVAGDTQILIARFGAKPHRKEK